MKKYIWFALALPLMGFRFNSEKDDLGVANAVYPLIQKVVDDACGFSWKITTSRNTIWSKGAYLIFKPVNFTGNESDSCVPGYQGHEMYARCYNWNWASDVEHIGKPEAFDADHYLFMQPTKDVDLGVFTCVDVDNWPYRDTQLESAPMGIIYEDK